MTTIEIKIPDLRKPPSLQFPGRCVNCGKPSKSTYPLKLNTGAQKRGGMVLLELSVPLCETCRSLENRIGNVTWIPFSIAGLLAGLVVFVPVLLLAPQGESTQTLSMPWVLAGAAALAAGLAGGTLVEFSLRLIFGPFFGGSLTRRPLTVVEFLNDSQHILGLSIRMNRDKSHLVLVFENDAIALEFESLNRGRNHEIRS
jgi:hypothetical protein